MILTGYAGGRAVGVIRVSFLSFLDQLVGEIHTLDFLFFVPKTIVAGAFAAAICCLDGLSVKAAITDVPRVSSRARDPSVRSGFYYLRDPVNLDLWTYSDL